MRKDFVFLFKFLMKFIIFEMVTGNLFKNTIANTKYAKATGGTPIISWIPNQITAVLNYMDDVINLIPHSSNFISRNEFKGEAF